MSQGRAVENSENEASLLIGKGCFSPERGVEIAREARVYVIECLPFFGVRIR
jgi:hypothetical protein